MKLLIVTAVAAERDAILAASPSADVLVAGVGPTAAAAATSARLASGDYDLVLSAGIGGGFAGIGVGAIAVASMIAFADLGAELAGGDFTPLSALGFGNDSYAVPAALSVELADCVGGHLGTILTVATVTGTATTAAAHLERFPDAVAEAMEGAGVAAAGAVHGVAVAELRAISNPVGPRDRDSWRIPEALASLGAAVATITEAGWTA